MSKFLTPPVWYDKNGKLNEMLTGTAMPGEEGYPLTNLSIGQYSVAGDTDGTPSSFGTAVGYGAKASGSSTVLGAESSAKNGIAIGSLVKVTGGIGIGGDVTNGGIGIGGNVTNGGIGIGGDVTNSGINKAGIGIGGNVTGNGIGIGGNATEGKIQLGNNNTAYTLSVGNGAGALEIGSIKFQKMTITDGTKVSISSQGVYLCCVTKNNVSGVAICFLGNLNGNATVLESSTGLCEYVARNFDGSQEVHEIQAKTDVAINYCFKIINTDM